jgi:crossover junction endodeoxyribonuclease RusA
MPEATITLPWPPTVNSYWRSVGKAVLISRQGREYRQTVMRLALVQRFPRLKDARIRMEIEARPPDRRQRDLDNLLKSVNDSLEAAHVFDNDGQIDDLRIWRGPVVKDGELHIVVTALQEATA